MVDATTTISLQKESEDKSEVATRSLPPAVTPADSNPEQAEEQKINPKVVSLKEKKKKNRRQRSQSRARGRSASVVESLSAKVVTDSQVVVMPNFLSSPSVTTDPPATDPPSIPSALPVAPEVPEDDPGSLWTTKYSRWTRRAMRQEVLWQANNMSPSKNNSPFQSRSFFSGKKRPQ